MIAVILNINALFIVHEKLAAEITEFTHFN